MRTLALGLAAALALTLASSAQAARQVRHDPAGDVVSMVYGEDGHTAAPANRTADLTRFLARHTNGWVRTTTKVGDLRNATLQTTQLKIRTPDRTFRFLMANEAQEVHVVLTNARGDRVRCGRAQGGYDMRADYIWTAIPRRCLGNPAWVRTGMVHTREFNDSSGAYVDDARRIGIRAEPKLGPRIAKG